MSARPRNIQLFDHITAVVLTRLYEAFPAHIDLRPLDIGGDVAEQVDAGEQEAFDMSTSVRDTITFLEQEGLLRVGAIDNSMDGILGFYQVRLTGAGIAILGQAATPVALIDPEGRQSWGARLRAALNDPEVVASAVRAIFSLV